MVKIPGVDPLSEGTIHRKRRKSSGTHEEVKEAPSATVSVAPHDVMVIEGDEGQSEKAAVIPDDVMVIEGDEGQTEKASVTPASAPAPTSQQKKDNASSSSTSQGTRPKTKNPPTLKPDEDSLTPHTSRSTNAYVVLLQRMDMHCECIPKINTLMGITGAGGC